MLDASRPLLGSIWDAGKADAMYGKRLGESMLAFTTRDEAVLGTVWLEPFDVLLRSGEFAVCTKAHVQGGTWQ